MKRSKRLFHSFILFLTPSARKRTEYIRKHRLFGSVGKNCLIQNSKLPLYSNLIFLHDNVRIASNVGFITHDVIHHVLNNKYPDEKFAERMGCIEVMDNVFIGAGTRIMYDTRIGSNVIIGAGSLVTKDIPDNSVYAGVPARRICSFDEYVEKQRDYTKEFESRYGTVKPQVDDKLAGMMREKFLLDRK